MRYYGGYLSDKHQISVIERKTMRLTSFLTVQAQESIFLTKIAISANKFMKSCGFF